MIQALATQYSVRVLCQALGVARSGYYAWRRSPLNARALADPELAEQIRVLYHQKRGTYGSPRVTAQLRREGRPCNHKRVERLMRQAGLQGRRSRRARPRTTQSQHDPPVAPNRLLGRPAPVKVDEVWVAEISYVPSAEGWLYVAALMDLYSRQILGWSVWDNLSAGGPLQALARALVKRGYPRGVIHHSDRGIQYACRAYREQLARYGLVASMSRKGNCYDNAAMEAFWSSLKREAMTDNVTWSKDQVRRKLFEYIESQYNRSRLHSSLGYQSPVDFEHQNS
jgi:putative transposase